MRETRASSPRSAKSTRPNANTSSPTTPIAARFRSRSKSWDRGYWRGRNVQRETAPLRRGRQGFRRARQARKPLSHRAGGPLGFCPLSIGEVGRVSFGIEERSQQSKMQTGGRFGNSVAVIEGGGASDRAGRPQEAGNPSSPPIDQSTSRGSKTRAKVGETQCKSLARLKERQIKPASGTAKTISLFILGILRAPVRRRWKRYDPARRRKARLRN